ncbi:MAG: FHA domain-containing protein [Planctomycetia bacterium]
MHHPDPSNAGRHEPATTLLESFDSWAQLLRHGESQRRQPGAGAERPRTPSVPEALPYRPLLRRPLALLHVVDDGHEDGETIRLRADRLEIGRTEGDVTIPHDISMSTRHAVLECGPGGTWLLSDAGSAGGTYVRVMAARLHDGSCLQLGASKLRFDAAAGTEPALVELAPAGDGPRHACSGPLTTIGRAGGGCDVEIGDPFISPRHAEVHAAAGAWRIENRGLNGLWVRISGPVKLTHPAQFMCGEQRFVFVPLGE